MKQYIYIIRHGQTDLNLKGIVQGSGVDSALNDTGRAQAVAFYEHYKAIPFEVVITSALRRTHETAQPFIETGLAWEQQADINEICWGVQEGKSGTPESKAAYRQLVEDWSAGRLERRMPEGESAAEMLLRMKKFREHLLGREETYILVVSHGRAMRSMMTVLLDLSPTQMSQFEHANTGLYQFELENGVFTAIKQNDTAHLVSV